MTTKHLQQQSEVPRVTLSW